MSQYLQKMKNELFKISFFHLTYLIHLHRIQKEQFEPNLNIFQFSLKINPHIKLVFKNTIPTFEKSII